MISTFVEVNVSPELGYLSIDDVIHLKLLKYILITLHSGPTLFFISEHSRLSYVNVVFWIKHTEFSFPRALRENERKETGWTTSD